MTPQDRQPPAGTSAGWAPQAGVPAEQSALDAYLRTHLPAGQQSFGNRDNIIRVILKVVSADERVITVAPCHFAGSGGAAVLVITSRRFHLADQAKPGRVYQNVSWPLSDITHVSLRPPGAMSIFPAAELEITTSDQQLRITRLSTDQAERALSDLTAARAWYRQTAQRGSPQAPTSGGHAFVCYGRESDSTNVDWLQRVLEEAGVPVWRDTDRISPGQDWKAVTRRAISSDDALVFLACFSRAGLARKKSHQLEELYLAIEEMRLRRPDQPWLIPVRFDECEIPDFRSGTVSLTKLQRADLFGPDREHEASRLAAVVRKMLSQPASSH